MQQNTSELVDRVCTVGQLLYATMHVQCLAIDFVQSMVYEIPEGHLEDCFCKRLSKMSGTEANIDHLYRRCKDAGEMHSYLIYSCPYSLSNIVVPVICDNKLVAALQVGPIVASEPEKILSLHVNSKKRLDSAGKQDMEKVIEALPHHDTHFLGALAQIVTMLLAETPLVSPVREIPMSEFEEKNVDTVCSSVITAALSYIANNYTSKISLNDVANNVYVHPAHLSRLFSKQTGCNFREYINRMRITKARELLLESSMNISAICNEVGFSDQSYFDKIFKMIEGVTPSEFRKSNLARSEGSLVVELYDWEPADKYRNVRNSTLI